MKFKKILAVCLLLSSNLMAQTKAPLIITGKITNPMSGKVYLEKMNERNIGTRIDSSSISGQDFKFNTVLPEPGLYQLNITNNQLVMLILDGGEKLTVTADGMTTNEKVAKSSVVGSNNMVLFNEAYATFQKLYTDNKAIDEKFVAAKSEAEKTKLRNQYLANEKAAKDLIFAKTKLMGTSMAGIISTNNFLTAEEFGPYRVELKERLIKEGKNHYFAKMYIQSINKLASGSIGSEAYNFNLTDINGKTVKLSDYKGKTVIVDFWATWCGPCIQSMPGMKLAQEKYKDNPNVAFLFIDTFERVGADSWSSTVSNFVKARNFTFMTPLLDIGNEASSNFGVEGIPAKFCINKEGKISHKSAGYLGRADAVLNEITEWVNKN